MSDCIDFDPISHFQVSELLAVEENFNYCSQVSAPTPKEEYDFLVKLLRERMSVHNNEIINQQYKYARDVEIAAREGRLMWMKNAIGYLLKYPTAPYVDPKYFPSTSTRVNVERASQTFDSIASQYASFPTPIEGSTFGQTLQYANANMDMRTLQGGPIQYTPTVQYQLGGAPANPPPAETNAIGWLEKGLDFAGNIASIGAGIFEMFTKW